jgi:hypothetical protein
MYIDERSNIDSLIVPALKLHMEIGWTRPIERLLEYYLKRAHEISSEETISRFKEAEAWLLRAKDHEGIHGKNSLLNREHRIYRKLSSRQANNADKGQISVVGI